MPLDDRSLVPVERLGDASLADAAKVIDAPFELSEGGVGGRSVPLGLAFLRTPASALARAHVVASMPTPADHTLEWANR